VKILHIGKYFPPFAGGMENYLRDLMTVQSSQGLEPSALVHQSDIGFASSDETYRAGDLEIPVTRAAVWARMLFTPLSPTFPLLIRRLIKKTKPDILHLHMPNVSVFWLLFMPSARKIPWVIHWQSDVLASKYSLGLKIFYSLYRPFETAVLRHCHTIIASSPPYLASSEPLQRFKQKCRVIPLGLSTHNLPAPAAPVEPDNTPLSVLAIGRLTYYKGFEYLIRAASECANIEIHLVGVGDERDRLEKLTSQLGLGESICFHHHVPDKELAQLFYNCDCLCLPSIERTEAFGLVLLEAMYHSRPTVISNVPGSGMGWIVDDGVTGLHVPAGDAQALAKTLNHLEGNRDKITHLGRNGRARFDELFNIEITCPQVCETYETALQGNPSDPHQAKN
jgi:glycosyltransferase involved in cell wall biosynthesis